MEEYAGVSELQAEPDVGFSQEIIPKDRDKKEKKKDSAARSGRGGGQSEAARTGKKEKKKKKKGSKAKSKGKKARSTRGSRSSTESLASVLSGNSILEDGKRPKESVLCSSVLSTANLQGSMMKGTSQNMMGSRLMGSTLAAGRMGELGRLKSSQLVAKPNLDQSIKRAKPGPMLRPMPVAQPPTSVPADQGSEEDCGYQQ